MDEFQCEVLIIGAGPAGLSAGVYCGRSGRDTIILKGKQRSALEEAKEVLNYPGYKNIGGIGTFIMNDSINRDCLTRLHRFLL